MRKLFLTAIVLGLFAVTPAALAQGERHQDGKSDQRDRPDKSNKSDQRVMSDQGRKSGDAKGHNETRAQGQFRDTPSMDKRKAMKTNRTRNAANTNRARNAANTNRTRNAVAIDRTPKTIAKGRPAKIMALQGNAQASQRFHAGSYQRPYGYQSHHWRYGERLPSFYFVSNYWINNYLMYALFAPLDGLIWVRVGADALLIDKYTGEIIRVEYGVFY